MPPQPTESSLTEAELGAIAEPHSATPPPSPEPAAQYSLELALAEQDLNDREEAREQRRKYARRIFRMVCFWLVLVGYIVLCQGVGADVRGYPFRLSDSVMIALITTTTATVIGVLAIVLNHLFPKRA